MKKASVILILIISIFLVSCDKKEEQKTTTEPFETHPPVEMTEIEQAPLSVKSPDSMDVNLPENTKVRLSDIDFDSMEEIKPEDSVFPNSGHDKILKGENVQFFFIDEDTKIHAMYYNENYEVIYVASYSKATGNMEFFGDDTKTWYFNENGEFICLVFTYNGENHDLVPVYSFYDANGEKDIIRTYLGWYTPSLDVLTDEEVLAYIQKYSFTIEATAQY